MQLDYEQSMREQFRLVILKELATQANESLNSGLMEPLLQQFRIPHTRAWLHQQLRYLAEIEAVTLIEAGSVLIATLTETGRRHLDRDIALEGVLRPSRAGA